MPSVIFNCCRQCQLFFDCATKWLRSEKSEDNSCCAQCHNFEVCEKISQKVQNLSEEKSA